jgi:predicted NBD/HSP70 family sugar kinase
VTERIVQPTSGAIRAANRTSVVDALRRHGAATRAEISRRTGLSRATVSSLVADLQAHGLVSERRGSDEAYFGRPPAVIALDRSAGLAIAIDVGVRHVAVAVGDLSRQVLAERWVSLPHGHDAITGVATVLRCVDEAIVEAGAHRDQLVGAAISIAAPVAPSSGHLLVPGVLPGWDGRELAAAVERRWNVPVVVENDANLGALAEFTWGQDAPGGLLYVKAASRVGLGIVLQDSIHHGADGWAGEFGHTTAVPGGVLCWCGRRGCLEMYAGGEGMLRQLESQGAPANNVAEIIALARAGDPVVLGVVESGVEALAAGLAALACVLNPAVIILGGELTALGDDLLLDPVRVALASLPFGNPIPVRLSTLGDRASLVGSLALVLSETRRFSDRSNESQPTGVEFAATS